MKTRRNWEYLAHLLVQVWNHYKPGKLQSKAESRFKEPVTFIYWLMCFSKYFISWAQWGNFCCKTLFHAPSISWCSVDISLLSLLASSWTNCPSCSNRLLRPSTRRDWIRKLSTLMSYASYKDWKLNNQKDVSVQNWQH